MLPPAKLAIDGPRMTGHVQSASGNVAVPPVAVLTAICPPVGLQVEAAQKCEISMANLEIVNLRGSARVRRGRREREEHNAEAEY